MIPNPIGPFTLAIGPATTGPLLTVDAAVLLPFLIGGGALAVAVLVGRWWRTRTRRPRRSAARALRAA